MWISTSSAYVAPSRPHCAPRWTASSLSRRRSHWRTPSSSPSMPVTSVGARARRQSSKYCTVGSVRRRALSPRHCWTSSRTTGAGTTCWYSPRHLRGTSPRQSWISTRRRCTRSPSWRSRRPSPPSGRHVRAPSTRRWRSRSPGCSSRHSWWRSIVRR